MKKLIALCLTALLLMTAASVLAEGTRTLVMATNASFPPYEYIGDNGEVTGIDAEIIAAIADYLGYSYQIDDMEFDAIITAVNSGKADLGMAGMTVTEERLQQVDFSEPYATGVQVVIVTEDSAITSVDDLTAEGAYHTIGVQLSTTGDLFAQWEIADEGFGEVAQYPNGNEAVMALKNGKVDCVIIDNEPAKAYVAANEGLKILDTEFAVESYAACFKKGSDLVAPFNEALKALTDDGTIPAIIEKYIPSTAE